MSCNTFLKYFQKRTAIVKNKIKNELQDKLSNVFDGWSSVSTHCTSVYAFYKAQNILEYKYSLVVFGLYENETFVRAQKLFDSISPTILVYGMTWNYLTALIGDNCSVNKSFSDIINFPIVGCAFHCHNLSFQDDIKALSQPVSKIHELTGKLKHLIPDSKLLKVTTVYPIIKTETRWTFIFSILERYYDIKESIIKILETETDTNSLVLGMYENEVIQKRCSNHE